MNIRDRLRYAQIPFVMRSTYERVRSENTLLKSALHEANKEIRTLRATVIKLKTG